VGLVSQTIVLKMIKAIMLYLSPFICDECQQGSLAIFQNRVACYFPKQGSLPFGRKIWLRGRAGPPGQRPDEQNHLAVEFVSPVCSA